MNLTTIVNSNNLLKSKKLEHKQQLRRKRNVRKNDKTSGFQNLLLKDQNCISNKKELKLNIKSFSRKIKLRRYFHNKNENQHAEQIFTEPVIKCKSNWEPKNRKHQSKPKSSYC